MSDYERERQAEPSFAAMAFLMEHQTTADDNFICCVTEQIRLLWEVIKEERQRGQRRPPPPFRLVGD